MSALHRIISLCLLLPLTGLAESLKSSGALEVLVVTATPRQDSVLTGSIITKTAGDFLPGARVDVAEVLQGLPGIQVDSRTNYAQDTRISLRGYGARSAFGVRSIDLVVDGVPMTMPDGQGQLSSVMLEPLASIQVLRGPIAVLYGNGGGGVIALQTALPETTAAHLGIATGQNGLQKQHLNLMGRRNDIGGNIAYSRMEQDGERPHAYAEREQLVAQLFYENEQDLQIRLKQDLTDDPILQDPLGLTPEQWRDDPLQANAAAEIFNTRKSVRHQQTSLSARQINGDWRWQAATWIGARDITQYLGFSGVAITGTGGVVDLEREFGGAAASFSRDMDFLGRPLVATLGAEWMQMEDHRRGYVNNQGNSGEMRRNEVGDVESRDIYSLVQMKLTNQLDIYLGGRRTWSEFVVDDVFIFPASDTSPGNPDDSGARDYANTSFALGARWAIDMHWGISVGYGRGNETPTLTEMAYKREGTGLNTALETAENEQYETGLYYQKEFTEFQVTAFIIDTDNELVVDQSLNGRTSYTNAAATRREGVEFLGRVQLSENWRLQTTATGIDATYVQGEFDNNRLPGIAKEQYQLDIQYFPFADDRLIVSAALHKRTSVAANDSSEVVAPGFYRVDAGLEGKLQAQGFDLGWWFKVINLTDENYVGSVIVNQSNGRAFEPAPGVGLSGGLNIRY